MRPLPGIAQILGQHDWLELLNDDIVEMAPSGSRHHVVLDGSCEIFCQLAIKLCEDEGFGIPTYVGCQEFTHKQSMRS